MFDSAAVAALQALPGVADVVADEAALRWSVVCDPREPYLDDHRPGGQPLLGTVGNLDAMACGLGAAMGDQVLVEITNVKVAAPLIFATGQLRRLGITVVPLADGRMRGTSHSLTDGVATVHLIASFEFADGFPAPPPVAAPLPGSVPVTSAEIYACLFHGPAFQVIARATQDGDRIVSVAASPLPPWRGVAGVQPLAPRVIEFGLQTAGLLQLAYDGTMMIPKQIATITRYGAADIGDFALTAAASRQSDGVMDIDIFDAATGCLLVRIGGYACEPLPFDHDDRAAATLARLLNDTMI